jgi:hypothetical protein
VVATELGCHDAAASHISDRQSIYPGCVADPQVVGIAHLTAIGKVVLYPMWVR